MIWNTPLKVIFTCFPFFKWKMSVYLRYTAFFLWSLIGHSLEYPLIKKCSAPDTKTFFSLPPLTRSPQHLRENPRPQWGRLPPAQKRCLLRQLQGSTQHRVQVPPQGDKEEGGGRHWGRGGCHGGVQLQEDHAGTQFLYNRRWKCIFNRSAHFQPFCSFEKYV